MRKKLSWSGPGDLLFFPVWSRFKKAFQLGGSNCGEDGRGWVCGARVARVAGGTMWDGAPLGVAWLRPLCW
jgi:hypothetical protein